MPPKGYLTILFTDVENSSVMNDELGEIYVRRMREPHFTLLRACLAEHNGYEIGEPAGDSLMAVFEQPNDALACARRMQEKLHTQQPDGLQEPCLTYTQDGQTWQLRVRIGLHKAAQYLPDAQGSYSSSDTNFAKRVESLGAGGQIIVHDSVRSAASDWKSHNWETWPDRRLRSFRLPESVHELLWDDVSRGEPGARWLPDWYRGERNVYIPREAKEKEILAHFEATFSDKSPVRLVTLKGFGGMGKTRLGLTCALQCVGLLNGNVRFVRLEDREKSQEAVAEAIGTALGLQGEQRLPANLNEGIMLNNLGIVYKEKGRWQEAQTCYQQSLTIRREFGDRRGEGQTLNNLGGVYQVQGC